MNAYDIDAWLGDAEATDEQRAAIQAASDAIGARWPDPDMADSRRDALNAAAMVTLGDETLEALAEAWRDARAREQAARAALTGAIIASGGTEVDLARRAGVTRMTVRKALGKG
ncbi:hypothetical protein [Actinotalea sp.]|uniref:hypothetical protein n=1 Tax=Actinotalea sp. TaxID=1872145 RepID=UPI00356B469C